MQNYQDSYYAANKKAKGIVYRFVDKVVEITVDDYLAENPENTAEDFIKLKKFSDADYREMDRKEYRQTWKNISLDSLEDMEDYTVMSAEDTRMARS